MELKKEFVKNCRKIGILQEFLCQAIDQIDERDKEIKNLKRAIWIVKAERFKSGYFHFDLEKDFWEDCGETKQENRYYEKLEQCARLEKICRQRAKELE